VAEKQCTKCGAVKPLADFWIRKDRAKPYAQCKSCMGARHATWWRTNPHKTAEYWSKRPVEKNREIYRNAQNRRRADPIRRFACRVRTAVYLALVGKRKRRPTFESLGYSLGELQQHIERQFVPGMSWDNYGEWHLDHIVPLSAFHFSSADDPEFRAAWALSNLRPLWASENVSKSSKRTYLL